MEENDSIIRLRQNMIKEQLIPRGIHDPLVLASLSTVPRHLFVPSHWAHYAYEDTPLPIAEGQTISQPFIVALMVQLANLHQTSRVLEIGTGSGYGAAVLSQIAAEVYTIERLEILALRAKQCFEQLHYTNITTKIGDGTLGWEEKQPFDAIIVTAGAPVVPEVLLRQLAPAGKMVIPVGSQFIQELRVYKKEENGSIQEKLIEWVRFVPLIGEQGWKLE